MAGFYQPCSSVPGILTPRGPAPDRLRYNVPHERASDPAGRRTAVTELQGIFRAGLRSVAIYGESVHIGATAARRPPGAHAGPRRRVPPAELRACAGLAGPGSAAGLATPLLLTATDLQRSLDAFPMEFDRILADHTTVYGETRWPA